MEIKASDKLMDVVFKHQNGQWKITSKGAILNDVQWYGATNLKTGAFVSMSENEITMNQRLTK